MMSRLYWVLNVVLVLGAVVASAWAVRQAPDARWGNRAQQQQPAAAPRESKGAPDSAGWDAAVGQVPSQAVDPDVLWRQTLFNPVRTEDTTKGGDAEAAAPTRVDLDLQGILQIGDVAAAIIVDKQARAPKASRPARGGARGAPDGGPEPQPEEVKTQHVYRVNDSVGGTGYVVKEIRLDEVVLTRGDEERILKLETNDADSVARRKTAADEEAKRDEEAKKEDVKREKEAKADETAKEPQKIVAGGSSSTPPPPPPPPPGVGVPGEEGRTSAPAALSAEERIQRAKELRERLLERRRNATPSQGASPHATVPAETH